MLSHKERPLEQLIISQISGSQRAPLTSGLFPNVPPEKENDEGDRKTGRDT